MSVLTLSDLKFGNPRPLTIWDDELAERVEVTPRDKLAERLGKFQKGRGLRQINVPADAAITHRNYLEYLERCWSDHLGVVVTPDVIWFTLLTELAALVKSDAERYRPLFSETQEKQSIIIVTADPVEMPLDRLIESMRRLVPTDVELFLPEFSTSTPRSQHAFHAAFCDAASPYYSYSMMLCGFPAIDVRGTANDWLGMRMSWDYLTQEFIKLNTKVPWFHRVRDVLVQCEAALGDPEWWKQMFVLTPCGSGSQTEVSGWFAELFRERPDPAYVGNFPTGVAQVSYRQLDLGKDYLMQDGLFYSAREGDFMVPDFGYTIHEKPQTGGGMNGMAE